VGKLFGEIDTSGRARVLLRKTFKTILLETEISKIEEKNLLASLTNHSIMDRIYSLPKLSPKQIKLAIQQKIKKDLEFIADISEVDWIYSAFPEKNGYRILTSIVKKDLLSPLSSFKALTTTSQVISNFLTKKIKKDFLLVHSFYDDYLIFVFRNGFVDYIRGFEAESNIYDSIELTLEYYKEQHKVEIKTVSYSGDAEIQEYPDKEVLPLNKLLKIKTNLKFLVPHALSSSKVPFFYEKKILKPIHATIPISLLFLTTGISLHIQNEKLASQISKLRVEISSLNSVLKAKQQKLNSLTKKEQKLKKLFSKPEVKMLLKAQKPEIYRFILSMKEPLQKSKSYFLTINGSKNTFTLSTITFCQNLEKPKEFQKLISFLKENKFISEFKLLSAEKLKDKKAITAVFKIKIRVKNYVKI